MEEIEKPQQNINNTTESEREHLKRLMTLPLDSTSSQNSPQHSPVEAEGENQSKIREHQVKKLMKRHPVLRKYSGTFNRKGSPSKEDIDIMKLALEETKNQIGSGLLQFEEVESDPNSKEQEDDDSLGETITKHPHSTFYFTVTEAPDMAETPTNQKLNQSSNQQSPTETQQAIYLKSSTEESKHSDSNLHSNRDGTPERKKGQKQKAKNALESPLNKIFGGNKKEKEALKHFKRFEEDFLRILQLDEEEKWKCVTLPTEGQKPKDESGNQKKISNPSAPVKRGNGNTALKTQESPPAHTSKSYFATLPKKLSIRRKKNEKNSTNSTNNQTISKTSQNKNDSQQQTHSLQKHNKMTNTFNTLLRSTNKKLDDGTLEQIFEQEKEQNWKSVILTKEELEKKEEERKTKLQKIEEKKRQKEKKLEQQKNEAMQIKIIEEEESKKKDAAVQRLELTVDRAFVVPESNEAAVLDSPSRRPFDSMMNFTRKLSTKLRRTTSAQHPHKTAGSWSNLEKANSLGTQTMNRIKFQKNESLKRINSNHEAKARNRHRSAPNYRYDRGSAGSESPESRGASLSRKNVNEHSSRDFEKSPISSPAAQPHALLRKAVSLFFIRNWSQERSEADFSTSQEELRNLQASDRNRPWFDLHNAMEGRWNHRRSRSWGAAMDHFERQYGYVHKNNSYQTLNSVLKRDVRTAIAPSPHTYQWSKMSSLGNVHDDVARNRSATSLNGNASEVNPTSDGERISQKKDSPLVKSTKSISMSEISSKQNDKKDLLRKKNSKGANQEANKQDPVDKNPPQVIGPKNNITVDDISATLQVAEEDQDPIKFDFNKINSVVARQNIEVRNDHNRNNINAVAAKLSQLQETQESKNKSVSATDQLVNNCENVENTPRTTTRTAIIDQSFQNEQTTAQKLKSTQNEKISENDGQHQLKQYEKVLEIQHIQSSSSVPYITPAKSVEESIYSGLGFYSTNSREESLTVYSSTGKEKLSIFVPGCPRGLTSFTPSHVLCTSCANGHIYVVDVARGNIVRKINRRPILKNPRYIAMHPSNRSYVTTDIRAPGKWSISMFDVRTGMSTAGIYPSNQKANLEWPGFLTFRHASELLHVSDSEKSSVFVYDMRKTTEPVIQYGKKGNGDGDLLNPCGVAYTNGFIAVADWGNNRVSAFDSVTGEFEGHVIENYNSTKLLEAPYDLASDANGCLYLTESETNKIKVFQAL